MMRSPSGSPSCCSVRSLSCSPIVVVPERRAGQLGERLRQQQQRPARRAQPRADVVGREVRRIGVAGRALIVVDGLQLLDRLAHAAPPLSVANCSGAQPRTTAAKRHGPAGCQNGVPVAGTTPRLVARPAPGPIIGRMTDLQVLDAETAGMVEGVCDALVPGSARVRPAVYVDALLARMPEGAARRRDGGVRVARRAAISRRRRARPASSGCARSRSRRSTATSSRRASTPPAPGPRSTSTPRSPRGWRRTGPTWASDERALRRRRGRLRRGRRRSSPASSPSAAAACCCSSAART